MTGCSPRISPTEAPWNHTYSPPESEPQQPYRSFNRARPNVRMAGMDIVSVKLKSNHDLQITERTYQGYDLTQVLSSDMQTFHLSDEVFNALLPNLQTLADAEVVTTFSPIVCMMMALPGADRNLLVATKYDNGTGVFSGPERLVLSAEGCYLSHHTAPKEAYAIEAAKMLRNSLQLLSLQYLSAE